MYSNELRIGNLVQNSNGEIAKVTLLDSEHSRSRSIRAWYIERPAYGLEDIQIEGIPLNNEWFEKLNFIFSEFAGGCYYQNELTICILKDGYYRLFSHTAKFQIKFVHELQNLYHALTGKELTYKP